MNVVFGLMTLSLGAAAQLKEDATTQQPPSPLYRDPIYDGAADPVLVYNRGQKEWQGQRFYRSKDAQTWEHPGLALDKPSHRNEDTPTGAHADVVVSDGDAYMVVKNTASIVDIVWDQSSLKQVSAAGGNYARMIQLHNGNLLCVYQGNSGIQCTTSIDLGKNWVAPVKVAASTAGVDMAVPDILELKDHSLLVSYNPRPHKINGFWDTTKRFSIVTKKSYDEGKSWTDERLIYQASYRFEDGCWEPSQIQLPSGEIQLFYSDEGVYTQSNEQNISIFRSQDGGLTWTKKPEIVSFTPGHRDGMPVPILLKGTNEILFSIEDNAGKWFKPSIIRNSITQNWKKAVGPDDAERTYAIAPKLPDSTYAGAPYLRQLHRGQTLLSYQSTQNRGSNWELACMQVAVGDSNGKNFVNVSQPFAVPVNKHGLWNSLTVLNDDTIIALTSTDAYGSNAIWMIKGHLTNKKLN